jgi:hypothetical protein
MGMAIDPVKLADWLRRATLSPKLPRIKQIEICQAFPNSHELTTASVMDWDEKEPIPKVEELLNDIVDRCETYANGKAEGTIRFMIQAYHGTSMEPWGTKFPCHVVARSPEAETASFGASEPATGQGLLSQLMRHIERREENANKKDDLVIRVLNKQIGDMQTKLDLFEGRHFDTIKLYEDLLDRKHERELNALFRSREDERKSKIWELVMSLGPMIASKFLDPRIVAAMPAQVTNGGPAMAMVRQLVKTIRPEQMPQLMQSLSTEQTLILMELHNLVEQETAEEQKREEEMRNVVPASREGVQREREAAQAPAVEEPTIVVPAEEVEPPMPIVPPEEPEAPTVDERPKKASPKKGSSSKKAVAKKPSRKKKVAA